MRSSLFLVVLLAISLHARQQPQPVSAPTTASSTGLPKPSPEIEKLAGFLEGSWNTSEEFAPSALFGNTTAGKGRAIIRRGPGELSLICDYKSANSGGKFSGLGIYTWDEQKQAFTLYWLDNTMPHGGLWNGKWEGASLIFTRDTATPDGKTIYFKQTYSDFSPSSFTFTQESSIEGGPLKRDSRVEFRRIGSKPRAR